MIAAVCPRFGKSLLSLVLRARPGGCAVLRAARQRGARDSRSLRLKCLLLAALLSMDVAAAAGRFQLVYNTPRGEDEKNARAFIEEEGITQTVSKLFDDEFELRYQLSLFLGGDAGPLFDRESKEIRMPYSFVFDIAERFERDSYSSADVNIYDVTRDAYLHALLHEASHALFEMYDLRTSGSMEKAVDALTILLLLRYYENGGDIVINAAELYVDESDPASQVRSPASFWSEHRLDQQSYNQALCLAYGSNPERYADLRAGNEFLQIRDQECVREYRRQANAWFRVLGSFLKRPPPE